MKRSTIWEHLRPPGVPICPLELLPMCHKCAPATRAPAPDKLRRCLGQGPQPRPACLSALIGCACSDSWAVCVGSVCISGRPSLPHHLAVCANCHLVLCSCLCMSHASFPALFTISPPCFSGATLGLRNRVPRPALDWRSVEGFHICPDISRGYDKHVNADSFQSCWDRCLACALSVP